MAKEDHKMSTEELADYVLRAFRSGKYNTEQDAVLDELEVALGRKDDTCKHDMDSYCDADNVFHCNGCGEVVPAPAGNIS